jgi:hypothetical protein
MPVLRNVSGQRIHQLGDLPDRSMNQDPTGQTRPNKTLFQAGRIGYRSADAPGSSGVCDCECNCDCEAYADDKCLAEGRRDLAEDFFTSGRFEQPSSTCLFE